MLMTTSACSSLWYGRADHARGHVLIKDDFQSAVAGQGDGNRAVRLGEGNGGFYRCNLGTGQAGDHQGSQRQTNQLFHHQDSSPPTLRIVRNCFIINPQMLRDVSYTWHQVPLSAITCSMSPA